MSESPKPIVIDTPVNLTVNGHAVVAQKGELLIDAAERAGTYIPRFCYHPRMNPVGMCRMCLVEVDTGRGPALQPSCMLECAEGMVVDTENAKVKKAQDGILEFLLINHPLDCPVCDKGGECPLQDATVGFGPGESRFVEEKRHHEKPIPLSSTVQLDRERCILCDRCTRFADEVAGDALIHFMHRGALTEVNTFPGEPFASYFSGNTVQICPVGALTATPYRFKARPWDLESTGSTCTGCSVGCQVTIESSRDRILRVQGVDSDAVNWSWLCDKGRFGVDAWSSSDRVVEPLVRSGGQLNTARWSDALDSAARSIAKGLEVGGPGGFAMIGGARGTNEAAYAWTKFAKGVIGSDHVDAQLGDGLPAPLVLGLDRSSLNDALAPGSTVIYFGADPKEELGVLYIRLRHAVLEDGVKLVTLSAKPLSLSRFASAAVTYRPGTALASVQALLGASKADDDAAQAAAKLIGNANGKVTIFVGRPSVAESSAAVVDAVGALHAGLPAARWISTLRRPNVQGALDLGMAPGVLPGRVALEDATDWFAQAWPTVPAQTGLDTAGILQACADGHIDTLMLVGADPLSDFPDRSLAERALAGARCVISVDQFLHASNRNAEVVLPVTGFGEADGTTTNFEGRLTALRRQVSSVGSTREEWSIAADLALRFGADFGWLDARSVWAEVEELCGLYFDATWDAIAASPEGVLVGVADRSVPTDAVPADAELADAELADPEVAPGDSPDAEVTSHSEGDNTHDGEVDESTDDGEELVEAPPLLTFVAPQTVTIPSPNGYAIRLVVTRSMYDESTLTQASATNRSLAGPATLQLSAQDFARIGVPASGRVRATTGERSLMVDAVRNDLVPAGVAWIGWGQANAEVGQLIDAATHVTDVHLEVAG